jgi:catechol 2,3-dioxygenase-like lactoylglutathione lyase family enzyme
MAAGSLYTRSQHTVTLRDVTDTQALAERFGLGAPDQISFAVSDVDDAAARYARVFGPFSVMEAPLPEIRYRGVASEASLKLAFAQCGPLEIELVEVVSGDHPATAHLAEKGEGFHHVRFPVTDLVATQAAMEAEGFTTTFSGGSNGVLFAYLEAPEILGGTQVELIQMPA